MTQIMSDQLIIRELAGNVAAGLVMLAICVVVYLCNYMLNDLKD